MEDSKELVYRWRPISRAPAFQFDALCAAC